MASGGKYRLKAIIASTGGGLPAREAPSDAGAPCACPSVNNCRSEAPSDAGAFAEGGDAQAPIRALLRLEAASRLSVSLDGRALSPSELDKYKNGDCFEFPDVIGFDMNGERCDIRVARRPKSAAKAKRASPALMDICAESAAALKRELALKPYSALFDALTGFALPLLGFARYGGYELDDARAARDYAAYLTRANMENALYAVGFRLDAEGFVPIGRPPSADAPALAAPLAQAEALELIARLDGARASLGYSLLKRVDEALFPPLEALRQWTRRAAPVDSRAAILAAARGVSAAYAESGFTPVFYEQADAEARKFYKYADGEPGYPALTRDGEIFRSHFGKRDRL